MRKGQSTLEYAVIIAAIAGALLAMRPYIKRSIQGRLRSAADDIGEQEWYEPGNTTSDITFITTSDTTTTLETIEVEDDETGESELETTTTVTYNPGGNMVKEYGTETVK